MSSLQCCTCLAATQHVQEHARLVAQILVFLMRPGRVIMLCVLVVSYCLVMHTAMCSGYVMLLSDAGSEL